MHGHLSQYLHHRGIIWCSVQVKFWCKSVSLRTKLCRCAVQWGWKLFITIDYVPCRPSLGRLMLTRFFSLPLFATVGGAKHSCPTTSSNAVERRWKSGATNWCSGTFRRNPQAATPCDAQHLPARTNCCHSLSNAPTRRFYFERIWLDYTDKSLIFCVIRINAYFTKK